MSHNVGGQGHEAGNTGVGRPEGVGNGPDDDGVVFEIDFVATTFAAAQDGEHDCLHAMRMAEAVIVIAASLPP